MNHWKALLFATACVSLAQADTLTMKNGQVVQGTYLGGNTREVRFDTGNGPQVYSLDQISSIGFQSLEADAPHYDHPRADERPRVDEAGPRYGNPAGSASGLTIPAGALITVRMIEAVDSQTAQLGQTYSASLDENITVGNQIAVPRGADVIVKLVEDRQSGRVSGQTVLGLSLQSIRVNGQMVDFSSEQIDQKSTSRSKRSTGMIGGGTALGAILGGIAGGGKGAAIGAISGAAAGTGAEVLTKGQRVRIPSETRLSFRTNSPVRL